MHIIGNIFAWGAAGLIIWLIAMKQPVGQQRRCVFCRSKLKVAWFTQGTTCKKCGKEQPWANAQTLRQQIARKKQERSLQAPSAVPSPPRESRAGDRVQSQGPMDMVYDLKVLTSMRESGDLTEEEFGRAKARLFESVSRSEDAGGGSTNGGA